VQKYKVKGSYAIQPGLPDGIFFKQKSKFGENLEGFAMENIGIFYGHFIIL
jgi:hypothetical protein